MQKNKVISKVFSVLLAWILFATVGTSNVTIAAAYAAPAQLTRVLEQNSANLSY